VCPIESQFDLVNNESDARFDEVRVISLKHSERVLLAKEVVTNQKSDQKWEIANAKQRIECQHVNLISLEGFSTGTKSDFCSTVYRMRYFFEYPTNDLEREINERKKRQIMFSEEEITIMLLHLLNAAAYLEDKGRSLGEVSPIYVMTPPATQQDLRKYKLIDRFWTEADPCEIVMENIHRGRDLYCSPEVYNFVRKGKKGKLDPKKNVSFSLGMTLLEAGCMSSVQPCYPYGKNQEFNSEKLKELVNEFKNAYPDNSMLWDSVEHLLDVDSEERWDLSRLRNEFPSEDEVLNHFNAVRGQHSLPMIQTQPTLGHSQMVRLEKSHTGTGNEHSHAKVHDDPKPTMIRSEVEVNAPRPSQHRPVYQSPHQGRQEVTVHARKPTGGNHNPLSGNRTHNQRLEHVLHHATPVHTPTVTTNHYAAPVHTPTVTTHHQPQRRPSYHAAPVHTSTVTGHHQHAPVHTSTVTGHHQHAPVHTSTVTGHHQHAPVHTTTVGGHNNYTSGSSGIAGKYASGQSNFQSGHGQPVVIRKSVKHHEAGVTGSMLNVHGGQYHHNTSVTNVPTVRKDIYGPPTHGNANAMQNQKLGELKSIADGVGLLNY
jgi:hypothetical protein